VSSSDFCHRRFFRTRSSIPICGSPSNCGAHLRNPEALTGWGLRHRPGTGLLGASAPGLHRPDGPLALTCRPAPAPRFAPVDFGAADGAAPVCVEAPLPSNNPYWPVSSDVTTFKPPIPVPPAIALKLAPAKRCRPNHPATPAHDPKRRVFAVYFETASDGCSSWGAARYDRACSQAARARDPQRRTRRQSPPRAAEGMTACLFVCCWRHADQRSQAVRRACVSSSSA